MDLLDTNTVAISMNGLELVALKKLSLVSHALASKLDYRASLEQQTLATVLDDVIRRIELAIGGHSGFPARGMS
jgi:hypothetical protein